MRTRVRDNKREYELQKKRGRPPSSRPCSVPGCERPHWARTWCKPHYMRWHKYGTLEHLEPRPRRPDRNRPLPDDLVDKTGGPEACWPWLGTITPPKGYGRYGRRWAHRVAYEMAHGPVPEGLTVDHECHNQDLSCQEPCLHRRCVNPTHLIARTHAENNARARERRRAAQEKS